MKPVTLTIGSIALDSPVILAPMAGVTNQAFRRLCREIELERTGTVSGTYVCEMITARAMVERNEKTMSMISFGPGEDLRSMQLYTTTPRYTYEAVRMIVEQDLADHIDMNFGCPVPKVTRRGGGSALPFKRRLYGDIVDAAVRATSGSDVPITVKFRIGIDDEHLTYLDAGRIAADKGAAAVTLHARTAAQRYSGQAKWDAIGTLVDHMRGSGVAVLGNGDIFAPHDAIEMMETTGCDGVEVGRGCLGRPWLFAEIAAQRAGLPVPEEPTLGEVTRIMYRHAELLTETDGEDHACRDIRKHISWYLRGFPVGGEVRGQLTTVSSLAELRERLAPFAQSDARAHEPNAPRGRQGGAKKVSLPDGWLEDPEDDMVAIGAEIDNSGG